MVITTELLTQSRLLYPCLPDIYGPNNNPPTRWYDYPNYNICKYCNARFDKNVWRCKICNRKLRSLPKQTGKGKKKHETREKWLGRATVYY